WLYDGCHRSHQPGIREICGRDRIRDHGRTGHRLGRNETTVAAQYTPTRSGAPPGRIPGFSAYRWARSIEQSRILVGLDDGCGLETSPGTRQPHRGKRISPRDPYYL